MTDSNGTPDLPSEPQRQRDFRRPIVASVLFALGSAGVALLGSPVWFAVLAGSTMAAGYSLIDAAMPRNAATAKDTVRFILLALAVSIFWGAAIAILGLVLAG